jgi:hypothetical protein
VEGLPVFEVPCQNMFKRRLEGSSSTRTIEKKKQEDFHETWIPRYGFTQKHTVKSNEFIPCSTWFFTIEIGC